MESKLFQLANWIEENKINISSVAYKSILELIDSGETSTSKEVKIERNGKVFNCISDWTVEVTDILKIVGIEHSFGNNSGKYILINDEQFTSETDYYLFEKEMPGMVKKAEEIVNQVDQTILKSLESDNFTLKTYLSRPEQVEFDWIEVIRHMPMSDRILTDKEKITVIINKS